MQIVSVTQYVDSLFDYLVDVFKDYEGLSYKYSDDPDSGLNKSKPVIYKYLMPSSDLVESYPVKSPCIVITVDSVEDSNLYSISVHMCVKYESVSEKEKVKRIEGTEHYEYSREDGYDTESDLGLYKSSLLFTEFVHNKLCMNRELCIDEINSQLPDSTLPDFPYCISSVTVKTRLNRSKIAQNPYNDLY